MDTNKKVVVSIITPTYNRPDLLVDAIQSVLDQTFGDWEMLIIEDGSDGSARAVVAGFNDSRLHYIYQDHAGRSAARNRGLEAATGEFIAFLDDDDLYHPDKLAKELAYLRENPDVDIVGSGFRYISENGEIVRTFKLWNNNPTLKTIGFLDSGFPFAICSVLISQRSISSMNHWFDPAFVRYEDFDFFRRLLFSDNRFAWLKEILSDVRIHKYPGNTLLYIHEGYQRVLDKLISSVEFPFDVSQQYHYLLLNHSLNCAWIAFKYKLEKTAQRFLIQALIEEPKLVEKNNHYLLDSLIYFTESESFKESPGKFLEYVINHLPAPLQNSYSLESIVSKKNIL